MAVDQPPVMMIEDGMSQKNQMAANPKTEASHGQSVSAMIAY